MSPANGIGSKVGTIYLEELLGEGGMGAVYAGFDEKLERRVAVKAVHDRHRLDDEARARFLREARILSRLKHPNICQIYDHIEGEDRDYLVLELIEGKSFKEALRDEVLPASRMRVAIQLTDAIRAAHEEGIVHRDLKPANVMLTPEGDAGPGRVKVLDFGIAKSLRHGPVRLEWSESGTTARPDFDVDSLETLTAGHGSLAGTAAYMSPEQARGEPATPFSDVYSLALLLQELFTGRESYESNVPLPIQLLKTSKGESLPVEGLDPDLTKLLERMKSFAPGARPSAADVAAKLRWIEAKPRRQARQRMKAAAVAALIIVTAVVSFQAVRISQEAERANREAAAARKVSDFLVELFEVSDPWQTEAGAITARQILDRGAQRIRSQLAEQPLTQARLLDTIGLVYLQLGLFEEARPLLVEGLELRSATTGGTGAEVATSLLHLGRLDYEAGEFDAARPRLEEAIALRREIFGEDHPVVAESLNLLAVLRRETGDLDAAEPLFRDALAIRELTLGPLHRDVAETLGDLGRLYQEQGDFVRAEELMERALKIQRAVLPEDHPDLGVGHTNLAALYYLQGDYERAAEYFQRDLEISERALGGEHPGVAVSLNNLASVYRQGGDFKRAASFLERSLAIREKVLGPEHPAVAVALHNLANTYRQQGEYESATPLYQRSQALWETALGPDHLYVASSLTHQAEIHRCRKQYAEAKALYERALRIREAGQAAHHPAFVSLLINMARAENGRGAAAAAKDLTERALSGTRHILADDPQSSTGHLMLAQAHGELGKIAKAQGEDERAREEWRLALDAVEKAGQGMSSLPHLEEHAMALLRLRRVDEARPLAEKLRRTSRYSPDFEELCRSHGLL